MTSCYSHFSAEETEVQGVVPSRKLAAAWDGSGSASFPMHQPDFTSQFNLARHSLVRPPPGPPCSSSELLSLTSCVRGGNRSPERGRSWPKIAQPVTESTQAQGPSTSTSRGMAGLPPTSKDCGWEVCLATSPFSYPLQPLSTPSALPWP